MKKKDLPSSGMAANIKVGSKVMCIDGSYTLSILNKSNKLNHSFLGLSEEVFNVIAVNVNCPSEMDSLTNSLTHLNNCIIGNSNGDIHFVSKLNIRNIESL